MRKSSSFDIITEAIDQPITRSHTKFGDIDISRYSCFIHYKTSGYSSFLISELGNPAFIKSQKKYLDKSVVCNVYFVYTVTDGTQ